MVELVILSAFATPDTVTLLILLIPPPNVSVNVMSPVTLVHAPAVVQSVLK